MHVFQLKLYFHTRCHVDWRLLSILCKKNNKDCFYEGCSIFLIDLNLNMGLMLYSKWVDVFKMFSVSHLTVKYSQNSQGVIKENNIKICQEFFEALKLTVCIHTCDEFESGIRENFLPFQGGF